MYGKEFLKAEDIQTILDIGRTRALDIMHMFIQSGQAIAIGRVYRVRREIFNAWLSPQQEIKPVRQFRVLKGGDQSTKPSVKKQFLKVTDIRVILDIGQTTALRIMRGFVESGNAFQRGRIYRVRIDVFYNWLSEMDGYKPDRKLNAI